MIKIAISSVFVDDQDKALWFYTDALGFVKKTDIPVGPFRWLTVVSPGGPDGIELLLEPNDNPAAKAYQAWIYQHGVPATTFGVDDIRREYDQLTELGVVFRAEPTAWAGWYREGVSPLKNSSGAAREPSWRPGMAESWANRGSNALLSASSDQLSDFFNSWGVLGTGGGARK